MLIPNIPKINLYIAHIHTPAQSYKATGFQLLQRCIQSN